MPSFYLQFRSLAHAVLFAPIVKSVLAGNKITRNLYPPWDRIHPIDIAYGIETSGFVPTEELHPDRALTELMNPYGPSQPGIVRRALTALGDVTDYVFADIGCGKGRVNAVASEFNFREIIGVELSHDLAEKARANAQVVRRKFPQRPSIRIEEVNAIDFTFPPGRLVLFLYHSFGTALLSKLILKLEADLANGLTELFVVYDNPVHGDLLDSSPAFKRWFAEMISCDKEEVDFGPDPAEAVVIWQSAIGGRPTPHQHPDRRIIITKPLLRAELSDELVLKNNAQAASQTQIP